MELDRKVAVQCTSCMKWRIVPEAVVIDLSDPWTCKDNKSNPNHDSCDAPQEDPESYKHRKLC